MHKTVILNVVWKQNSGTILVLCNEHTSKALWKSIKYAHPIRNNFLFESGFSTLLSNKTKSINCLNAQADMKIAINNKVSLNQVLCNKQKQKNYLILSGFKIELIVFSKYYCIFRNLIYCRISCECLQND